MNFRNPHDLRDWLVSKNIDLSQWGKGSAKTIDSLWSEIDRGEVTLQDDPPLRTLNLAQVLIIKGDNILIETEQVLSDGRIRNRNRAPSEKMKPHESYQEAAVRCLQEELGVSPYKVKILNSSYRRRVNDSPSPSYPGLNTRYIIHTVEAEVDDLPNTDFWTKEAEQGQGVVVDKHYWSWKLYNSIDF